MPVTLKHVLGEESDATGANTQGSWGEAIDVFSMQEGGLERLFGEQVGRCAIALSQQASLTNRGLLGTLPLATELKRGNHLWTQGGHEISPFLS